MSTRSSTPTSAVGGGSYHQATASSSYLGVTRSRTLLFQSYRDSVPRDTRSRHTLYEDGLSTPSTLSGKGKKRAGSYFDASGELQEETQELLNEENSYPPAHHRVDMTGLPPRWVDTSDEVESILTSLRPKIAQLERLHSKHVLPGFVDRSEEEREIERETTEITKEFRKCSKLIAGLSQNTQQMIRSGKSSKREIAMAQNVQTALATRVQDASGAFRRKQSNYMQRLRGHETRHNDLHSSMGRSGTVRDSEWAVQEDIELSRQQLASSKSNQSLQQQQQQSQLLLEEERAPVQADANIAQRDREIDQIAKSIAELAELFQDLSALVIDQGTMLDRIDFNIEHMGQQMNEAVKELHTATRYQKRTSRGQCILFLILLVFLLITIIIVKPFWRVLFPSKPSTPSV